MFGVFCLPMGVANGVREALWGADFAETVNAVHLCSHLLREKDCSRVPRKWIGHVIPHVDMLLRCFAVQITLERTKCALHYYEHLSFRAPGCLSSSHSGRSHLSCHRKVARFSGSKGCPFISVLQLSLRSSPYLDHSLDSRSPHRAVGCLSRSRLHWALSLLRSQLSFSYLYPLQRVSFLVHCSRSFWPALSHGVAHAWWGSVRSNPLFQPTAFGRG